MTGSTAARPRRRPGRPPAIEGGPTTPERLLDAAVEACIERGYDGATLADIADRADISTMAVYNHFDGKASLLMAAARRELARLDERVNATLEGRTPAERARSTMAAFLAPDAASSRRFFAELNCVAHRHPDLEALLDEWKRERESWWAAGARSTSSAAAISKAYQLLLLGACQFDTYRGLRAPSDEVVSLLQEAAAQLFM